MFIISKMAQKLNHTFGTISAHLPSLKCLIRNVYRGQRRPGWLTSLDVGLEGNRERPVPLATALDPGSYTRTSFSLSAYVTTTGL
jgi:hypothetical protein